MDNNSVLSIFNRENRLLLLVVFCFFLSLLLLLCFFFLKTLNCCFCSWVGGGGRDGGDFSSCLVLFVLSMSLSYLENIFVFLEGKVIKFIVQKGVYLGSKMKLLCLGACLVCLM